MTNPTNIKLQKGSITSSSCNVTLQQITGSKAHFEKKYVGNIFWGKMYVC
jgi:hypothetical protein